MTERYIKQNQSVYKSLNNRSLHADIDVSLAWQSSHQQGERMAMYGLDRMFLDSLQPALLHVYRWVSEQWQTFLQKAGWPPKPVVVIPPASASVALSTWLDSSATVIPSTPSGSGSLDIGIERHLQSTDLQSPCPTCGTGVGERRRKRSASFLYGLDRIQPSKQRVSAFH
jgi:hypothetical protein